MGSYRPLKGVLGHIRRPSESSGRPGGSASDFAYLVKFPYLNFRPYYFVFCSVYEGLYKDL